MANIGIEYVNESKSTSGRIDPTESNHLPNVNTDSLRERAGTGAGDNETATRPSKWLLGSVRAGARRTKSMVRRLLVTKVRSATRGLKSTLRRAANSNTKRLEHLIHYYRVGITAIKGRGIPANIKTWTPGHKDADSRRVLIISLSAVFDDPRIRRQAVGFESRGWQVHLAGFHGRSEGSKKWRLIPLDRNRIRIHAKNKWLLPLSGFSWRFAETYYWMNPSNLYMWNQLANGPWALIVANDYPTVPIAATLAEAYGVDFVVDCHEYAREQAQLTGLSAHLRWKAFRRPYIDAINKRFLRDARMVSTVSNGISILLKNTYRLARPPTVVRSLPVYESHTFRPCGDTLRVLYHGGAVPSRGLEQLIDSVPLWGPQFRLCLRLVSTPDYLESLKLRVERLELGSRVDFLDPVPFTEMVSAATFADIGYHVPLNFSPQIQFSLPNKLFEYPMAGLAVVCADLPEWRRIGDHHGHCVYVSGHKPGEIATAINGLSRSRIDDLKRRSLRAAEVLCWENEKEKMLQAYLPSPKPQICVPAQNTPY